MKKVIQRKSVPTSTSRRKSSPTGSRSGLPASTKRAPAGITVSGVIRRSVAATRASRSPRITRKRTDSGRITQRTGASRSGRTPPSTRTERHP